jgi:ubiquinone/menaquinone biosynthesis C-methylase UbiE
MTGVGNTGLPKAEVPGAFDIGASAYDRLVGANPGYHDHLRISARRLRIPNGGRGLRLLDAGCGTGASTAALLEAAPHAEIVAVDALGRRAVRRVGGLDVDSTPPRVQETLKW